MTTMAATEFEKTPQTLSIAYQWLRTVVMNWTTDPKAPFMAEIQIEPPLHPLDWLTVQITDHRKCYISMAAHDVVVAGIGHRSFMLTEIDRRQRQVPSPVWYDPGGRRFKSIVTLSKKDSLTLLRAFIPPSGRETGVSLVAGLARTRKAHKLLPSNCISLVSRFSGDRQLRAEEVVDLDLCHLMAGMKGKDLLFFAEPVQKGQQLQYEEGPFKMENSVNTFGRVKQGVFVCFLTLPQSSKKSGTDTHPKDIIISCEQFFLRCGTSLKVGGFELSSMYKVSQLVAWEKEPNINSLWARAAVEELARLGVTNFFIAPGSRSSALVRGVALNEKVRHIMVHDERGAGFLALSCSRSSGSPSCVITSSGTAVANLLPAVVEASNAGIPMIILTADRPPELRNCGAPQTIDQTKIFGGFVRHFEDVPCPTDVVPMRTMLSRIDYAAACSSFGGQKGPVHLNFMFREHLAPEQEPWASSKALLDLRAWRESEQVPLTTNVPVEVDGDLTLPCASIVSCLTHVKKCIIVVGGGLSPNESVALQALAHRIRVPIVADVLSSLRFGTGNRTKIQRISYSDLLLGSERARNALLDESLCVLQFGSRVTSSRLWSVITDPKVIRYVINKSYDCVDDSHNAKMRIVANAESIVETLFGEDLAHPLPTLNCFQELCRISAMIGMKIPGCFPQENARLVEPFVALEITKGIRKDSILFASNSMPIRDLNSCGADTSPCVVMANRGANGIDGIISSAIGTLLGSSRPVTLLVGDIAFLHDLSALHTLREYRELRARNTDRHKPWPAQFLTIVVVNNRGGGIFSFLPIAKHADLLTTYFSTPHSVSLEGCCSDFGLKYLKVTTQKEFTAAFMQSQLVEEDWVIEACVGEKDENVIIHNRLQTWVCGSVDTLLAKQNVDTGGTL